MKPKFSERVNSTPAQMIQIESMDDALRNSLWNFIFSVLNPSPIDAIEFIGVNFFKSPHHKIPTHGFYDARDWFWKRYSDLEWYGVYDLLEFVVENGERFSRENQRQAFERGVNDLLAREVSGYRFVQGSLSPISDTNEVEAIEQVVARAKAAGLNGVRAHIETAIKLLGKKPEPDYRNSIKESISAVESAAKSMSGVGGGGLDEALKELMKHTKIHGALRDGFLSLYGYSSDEKGIRHAMLEDSNKVGFDEAKFMLVACSAAANFLIAKANESGILKK